MRPGTSLSILLTLFLIASADAQTFTERRADVVSDIENELESQAAKLKSAEPKEKLTLAESHARTHVRLAIALADEKRYALAVSTLRRAKAVANQHMIFRRAREVVSALDDQIAFIEWREKSDGRGLRCELFDDTEFKSPRKVRHADKLSFITWSDPDIDVPGDAFCMRWTGFLRPPVAGRYKLLLRGDDTAQIWLDEKLVLDVTRNRGEAIIDLTTKPTALRAELTDLGGAAAFSFQWIAPGTDRATVVPSDCFFTDAEAAARLGGKPLTFPRGRGLRAELFAGRDFQRPLLTRTDADINNDFERAAPDPRLPVAFSIRWSGFLKPPKPGRYKLTASVDDGVRLWIDNHLVLERWPSFPNDHDVTLDLTARPHMIVVEYHQIANPGFITLHWQNLDEPNAPRVPIPPEAFFTDRAVAERAGVFDLKLEQ